ncbi:MAG: hypothetical protein HY369_05350 [Candidatus Aenigmarchaeota archaeon]|nr:hypothetical protein [Candidatus Aenigmarchaeota archaeon]
MKFHDVASRVYGFREAASSQIPLGHVIRYPLDTNPPREVQFRYNGNGSWMNDESGKYVTERTMAVQLTQMAEAALSAPARTPKELKRFKT